MKKSSILNQVEFLVCQVEALISNLVTKAV